MKSVDRTNSLKNCISTVLFTVHMADCCNTSTGRMQLYNHILTLTLQLNCGENCKTDHVNVNTFFCCCDLCSQFQHNILGLLCPST